MTGQHVLVLGVALNDRPSLVNDIDQELDQSHDWAVQRMWYQLGQPRVPKFVLINQLLRSVKHLSEYAYVLICDDDIVLPPYFLDRYLRIVERHQFALAQPARTIGSHIHHPIVQQVLGVEARRTRFVEIGPLFSVRQNALPIIMPFDEDESPMGWGYEYVWPVLLEMADMRMGIVDATPVEHTLREPHSEYAHAGDQMTVYLSTHQHLAREESEVTVETFHA